MMNHYRGLTPGGGSCGCGRGRTDMNPPLRSPRGCGGRIGDRPVPFSTGNGRNDNRTPCGCNASNTTPRYENKQPRRENDGCGCGCDGQNHDNHLMDQIRAVDFALYETVLYLDVYPHSCDALETYHKLKAQSEALHKEYEASRAPITAFGNQSTTSWDWMSKPFPWEYGAD